MGRLVRESTAGKYLKKRRDGLPTVTDDVARLDKSAFVAGMSQKTIGELPRTGEFRAHLICNANQSLLASMEVHNTPMFPYRYPDNPVKILDRQAQINLSEYNSRAPIFLKKMRYKPLKGRVLFHTKHSD